MPSASSTLTSANAVITLTIAGVYSTPQQLQGFSTDNIYDVGDQVVTQVMMGVDGHQSGGYVIEAIVQTFTLMADSASNEIFQNWVAAQKVGRAALPADGRTLLPATGDEYILTNGFLTSHTPMPTAGKVLEPRKFAISWESVLAVPA